MGAAHALWGAAQRAVGAMKVSPFGRRTRLEGGGGGAPGSCGPGAAGRRGRGPPPPCIIRVRGVERGSRRAGRACGLGRGSRREAPEGAGLLRGTTAPRGSGRAGSSRDSYLRRCLALGRYCRVSCLLCAFTPALVVERGARSPPASGNGWMVGPKIKFSAQTPCGGVSLCVTVQGECEELELACPPTMIFFIVDLSQILLNFFSKSNITVRWFLCLCHVVLIILHSL